MEYISVSQLPMIDMDVDLTAMLFSMDLSQDGKYAKQSHSSEELTTSFSLTCFMVNNLLLAPNLRPFHHLRDPMHGHQPCRYRLGCLHASARFELLRLFESESLIGILLV